MAKERHKQATLYYQESGVVPIMAIPVMFLVGVLTAFAFSPIVMLLSVLFAGIAAIGFVLGAVFVVPLFHGGLVCAMVDCVAGPMSVRNQRAVKIVSGLCILVAFYSFMHSQVWFHGGAEWDNFFPLLAPESLWRDFSAGLEQCHPVGVFLISLFALIFFCLYLAPVFLYVSLGLRPYCEDCGTRCKEHSQKIEFRYMNKSEFQRGNFRTLIPAKIKPKYRDYFVATFYSCPECRLNAYLRVFQHTREVDNKGDTSEKNDLVLDLLIVPYELGQQFDGTDSKVAQSQNRI